MTISRLPRRGMRRVTSARIPAAIQSWGVFLAVDPGTWRITHVSENTATIIGVEATRLLGQKISDVVGTTAFDSIRNVISGTEANPTEAVINRRRVDVVSHHSGDSLFVELEPRTDDDDRPLLLMRDALRSMATSPTASDLWARAASAMRTITGYDRVDISFYHPDGHGEVVAAAQADDLESHFGIHFSDANIPDEPSRVYLTKPSRMVVNVRESVDLLADAAHSTAVGLDLTSAGLSAPSARDFALLSRVGYGSMFFIAIVRNGALLGVINCGHRSERTLRYALRDALELLANQLALQFGAMEEIRLMRERDEVRGIRAALVSQVANGHDIIESLLSGDRTLLDFIPGDGAAIFLNGRLGSIGRVPPEEILKHIPAAAAEAAAGTDFSSDAVPIEFPELARHLPGVTGLLIRRLGNSGDYIGWFRGDVTVFPEWIADISDDDHPSLMSDAEPRRTSPPTISGSSAHWAGVETEASELVRELSSILLSRSTAEIAKMAWRDPLTALPNRRALLDALTRRLQSDDAVTDLAIIFIDIDEFKSINDAHGHAAGDAALIHVARSLQSAAREDDLVARLGGDEFVVVLNGVDSSSVERIASRMLEAVRTSSGERGWTATVSIGVAFAEADQTVSELLSAADAAMFRAKLGGRDRASH